MRYCIALKFLALILCACCLLTAAAAGVGVLVSIELGLYESDIQQLKEEQLQRDLEVVARQLAMTAALEELGSLPARFQDEYARDHWTYSVSQIQERMCYIVTAENGRVLSRYIDTDKLSGTASHHVEVSTTYPVVLGYEKYGYAEDVTTPTDATTATEPSAPTYHNIVTQPDNVNHLYVENWIAMNGDEHYSFRLGICRGPTYQVLLYVQPGDLLLTNDFGWEAAELLYHYRYDLIWIGAAALVIFAALFVYLCCAAGHKPGSEEIRPGGLNRLPLDLYGVATALGLYALAMLCFQLLDWAYPNYRPMWLPLAAAGGMAFCGCLLGISFLFACVAQLKAPGFFWAKHSLVGLTLRLCWKILRWFFRLVGRFFRWIGAQMPKVRALLKRLFGELRSCIVGVRSGSKRMTASLFGVIGNIFKAIFRGIGRFFTLLPLTWQWILVGTILVLLLMASLSTYPPVFRVLGLSLCIGMVLYGAHCFGTLLESTKRMSQGDLQTKVEDKFLLGSFRVFANHLNALADVTTEAAHRQMKSERMKAELVTNVSHDIKTPLTSIINYVDLLQNAQSQEEAASYLEVLDRQAQRLKKLIDDLMEMSKASTGNMQVQLQKLDAAETVTQALGEFSEKMEGANLIPVFQPPENPITITADGRLVWRVLSNLLGNAVKYAMPGTRLYIDLTQTGERVQISLKNISAQPLNVSADELLERFVRGDASRNTEGSGLGLNIAKSLMDLQGGHLELLVDGDLFKVTLDFPK